MSDGNPQLYTSEDSYVTRRTPCPQLSTQEVLDLLADSDILTSVVYGSAPPNNERYFSVSINSLRSGEVLSNPVQCSSFDEAAQTAYQIARKFGWIQ